jgi:hypothetical protein
MRSPISAAAERGMAAAVPTKAMTQPGSMSGVRAMIKVSIDCELSGVGHQDKDAARDTRDLATTTVTVPVMLMTAFDVLTVAVVLGTILALLHLRTNATPPPWPIGALHGLLAIAGFCCLLLALRGPPRGAAQGVAAFGLIAAVLFALAALLGLVLLAARLRKQQIGGGLIGIHATLAVSGFVILAAYVFLG